jgi:hypothetical protein
VTKMNLFLKKYGKMFDNITQVTKYFKRWDLNKYRKMIRVDDIIKTFHFAVFFQTTTFEMKRCLFSEYFFAVFFSNCNVWNTSLLVFHVSFSCTCYSYLIFGFCRGAKTITLGNIVLLWLLLEAIACCSIGRNRYW